MAYDMAGVTRAAQADPRRRAVRPVRLQGAAPPRGAAAVRQGEGARSGARRRHRARRRPPVLPVGRAPRRRQPDRCRGLDEDRRALLAAARRGRRPPGPRHARARRRAGVGRPDAGGHRGRDGHRRRAAHERSLETPPLTTTADAALGRRRSVRRPAPWTTLDVALPWDPGEAIGAFLEACATGGSSRPPACRASGRSSRLGSSASAVSGPPTGGRRSPRPAPSRRSRSATSRGTCSRSTSRSSRP